jgi:hypothetical protein
MITTATAVTRLVAIVPKKNHVSCPGKTVSPRRLRAAGGSDQCCTTKVRSVITADAETVKNAIHGHE